MLEPKGYCTKAQIEDYLLVDIVDDFEGRVDEWIAQMEKYVEQETGRIFIADSEANERVYDGEGGLNLFLEESVEITKVTIDDVEVASDDYLTYPANEMPKTRIKLKDDSGLLFTKGEQNIEIEGKWGYSVACPADVSFATMIFVVGIVNFSGEMEGEVKTEKIGGYQVTFKDKTSWQDLERAKEILVRNALIVI